MTNPIEQSADKLAREMASKLNHTQRASLAAVCRVASSRRAPEWVRMDQRNYDALRRRKLIGSVTTMQPDRLDGGPPWRLCYAHLLGLAVRRIIEEGDK